MRSGGRESPGNVDVFPVWVREEYACGAVKACHSRVTRVVYGMFLAVYAGAQGAVQHVDRERALHACGGGDVRGCACFTHTGCSGIRGGEGHEGRLGAGVMIRCVAG